MVDSQPVHESVVHELERLCVRDREHVLVLLPHPGELADVEEAPMLSRAQVEVEEQLVRLRIRPERVLLRGRHVIRHDVEHDAEPG